MEQISLFIAGIMFALAIMKTIVGLLKSLVQIIKMIMDILDGKGKK